jgi:hypothetical protein
MPDKMFKNLIYMLQNLSSKLYAWQEAGETAWSEECGTEVSYSEQKIETASRRIPATPALHCSWV